MLLVVLHPPSLYTIWQPQMQRLSENRNTDQWISTRVNRQFVLCVVESGTSWSGVVFEVEPVRLSRCSLRLWGKLHDSGIDVHDVQGRRCHEAGKGVAVIQRAASAVVIDYYWRRTMKMMLECGDAGQGLRGQRLEPVVQSDVDFVARRSGYGKHRTHMISHGVASTAGISNSSVGVKCIQI